MALKSIFLALVLAAAVAAGWKYAPSRGLTRWLPVVADKRKPIVFDNGTIREVPPVRPSDASFPAPVALHAIRRCQKGTNIVYTDNPCQSGFRELPVARGSITVLESPAARKAPVGSLQPLPRATLQDALDESGNANLREKRLERVINQ